MDRSLVKRGLVALTVVLGVWAFQAAAQARDLTLAFTLILLIGMLWLLFAMGRAPRQPAPARLAEEER